MIKYSKTFLFILLVFVLTIFLNPFNNNRHNLDFEEYKKYLWIIKDSIKHQLDTSVCVSYKNKYSVNTFLKFQEDYNIFIWEFKNSNIISLREVIIDTVKVINSTYIGEGEILFASDNPEIYVRNKVKFKNLMKISLDYNSSFFEIFNNNNYKAFLAKMNKGLIVDDKGISQVLFDFSKRNKNVLGLVFIKNGNTYFVLISSEIPLNHEFISLFNIP